VTEQQALRRLELALGVLGLTVALLAFIIALDAIRYHGLDLLDLHAHSLVLIAIVLVDGVIIVRACASLARQLRARWAFLRALPVSEALVCEHRVRVFPGRALGAFCAGLLRPAVYVSEGTLRATGEAELHAILAHEERHRRRRDPLRLLLARVVSDAIGPLPPFATLADRQAAIADLVADAAAVDALGDVSPLAAAFARFDERGVGVAPERVDRLVRQTPAETVPYAVLVAAAAVLAGIAALLAPMLLLHWHPDLVLPVSTEPAVLIAVCAPACLAAHRAGLCLRPSP
jgi:Zn-dependent protease with chaperone function